MTDSERRGNERRRQQGYVRPYSKGSRDRYSAGIVVFPEVDRNAVKAIHARHGPIGLVEFNDGWYAAVRNPEIGKRYHPNHGAMNKFGAERAFNDAVVRYNKYERQPSKGAERPASTSEATTWNYMPCRLPAINHPVLVVKGDEKKTFVREAVYTGKGYWRGFGDAPVLAWRPLPHTPISLELKTVLDERDTILDKFERKRTAQQKRRLLEIDRAIELAQQARESPHERFVRECFEALKKTQRTLKQ